MAFEWKMVEVATAGLMALGGFAYLPFYWFGVRRARKLSAYALPDRNPAWTENEQSEWFASGSYSGSWMPGVRARALKPAPVVGRGFEHFGKGRIWLLEEGLVFQRKDKKPPIAIPYALIHCVAPTAGAIPESHRWLQWSHCYNPVGWPIILLSFLPHFRSVNLSSRKGAKLDHLRITWGRRDLPMVSELQVSTDIAVTAKWVAEIERRAKAARRPGYKVA